MNDNITNAVVAADAEDEEMFDEAISDACQACDPQRLREELSEYSGTWLDLPELLFIIWHSGNPLELQQETSAALLDWYCPNYATVDRMERDVLPLVQYSAELGKSANSLVLYAFSAYLKAARENSSRP